MKPLDRFFKLSLSAFPFGMRLSNLVPMQQRFVAAAQGARAERVNGR